MPKRSRGFYRGTMGTKYWATNLFCRGRERRCRQNGKKAIVVEHSPSLRCSEKPPCTHPAAHFGCGDGFSRAGLGDRFPAGERPPHSRKRVYFIRALWGRAGAEKTHRKGGFGNLHRRKFGRPKGDVHGTSTQLLLVGASCLCCGRDVLSFSCFHGVHTPYRLGQTPVGLPFCVRQLTAACKGGGFLGTSSGCGRRRGGSCLTSFFVPSSFFSTSLSKFRIFAREKSCCAGL